MSKLTFLFTEKADHTPTTMIRPKDHVGIGDRIYWVLYDPRPMPFVRAEKKERGWRFHAIELTDSKALELIKETGRFTDLNPAQILPTIKSKETRTKVEG